MTGDQLHTVRKAGWSNTTDGRDAHEILSFHRAKDLPGVEIRSLQNSERAFHVYSTDFEFFAPSTWRGELWHRRCQRGLGPGSILCAHPGEVFSARRVLAKGGADFLTIDALVFRQYLSEHTQLANRVQLRAFSERTKALDEKLREVIRVVQLAPSALEMQSALVELMSVVAAELLEEASGETHSLESGLRAAERVRECLHYDSSATVDLSTLAKQAGISRYQALRLFKRRYGLPPHTYQLSVRVALAQKALREGQQPVHVAAHYGFVDQSHFTRHFKRLLGVTPAQYARAGARPRAAQRARPDTYLGGLSSERTVSQATSHRSLV